MDKGQSHVIERILDLTLEIIYLLTGEDCEIVKKLSREPLTPSKRLHETLPLTVLPPHCLTPESKAKKVLEASKKMMELLTGEVPIRCQDVSVYFSMEEWEYLEGHKELYKDIMMASQSALTSPDGSSNGNPPETWPHPLYSRDSTQEDLTIPHHHQVKELRDIKVEIKEEDETFLIGVQQSIEDEGSLYTWASTQEDLTTPHYRQGSKRENIKVKVKKEKEDTLVSGDQPSMEEREMIMKRKQQESSLYINTSGHYVWNSSKDRPISSPGYKVIYKKITQNIRGANLIRKRQRSINPSNLQESAELSHIVTPDIRSEGTERSTDPSNAMEYSFSHGKDGVNLLLCSVCGKSFPIISDLYFHLKTHTGDKPYLCLECGKCFNVQKHLYSHQRLHLGARPYSCSICDKSFVKRQSFVIHLRVHTGEKPYLCKECGKGFTQQSNLRRHQRSHAGIRRFMCSECEKSFTSKRNLLRHLNKTHAVQCYQNIGNQAPGHPI